MTLPKITAQTVFRQLAEIADSKTADNQIVSFGKTRGLMVSGNPLCRGDTFFKPSAQAPEFKQSIARVLMKSLATRVGEETARQLVTKNLKGGGGVVFVSELRSLLSDLKRIDASDNALLALAKKHPGSQASGTVKLARGFLELAPQVRNSLGGCQLSEASLRGVVSEASRLLRDVPFEPEAATKATMRAMELRAQINDYVMALEGDESPECRDLHERLTALQDDLTAYKTSLFQQMANGAKAMANLKPVIEMRYQAALQVLTDVTMENPELLAAAKPLMLEINREMLEKGKLSGSGEASKELVSELKKLPGALQKRIASVLPDVDKKEVKKLFQQAFRSLLDKAPWEVVSRDVQLYDDKLGQTTVTSRMTPARLIGLGDTLAKDSVNGVNSADSSSRHIVNLWKTEASHVKPDGIKTDEQARSAANLNRVKEMITAALNMKPELREKALAGENVELPILSVSLLSPNFIFPGEKSMVSNQMAAFAAVNNRPITVSIDGREVTVKPKFIAFNYGVEKFAKSFFFGTDSNSNVYNEPAMRELLGEPKTWHTKARGDAGSRFGGLVGSWLEKHAGTPDAVKVRHLAEQIAQLQESGRYRTRLVDPYALPARLLLIAHLIGLMPAFNCKSGKDRTGQLDVAVKTLAYQMNKVPVEKLLDASVGEARRVIDLYVTDPMKKATALQLHEMNRFVVNSGNLEIQRINTGFAGSKTANYWAYSDGLRNQFRKDAYEYYKGLQKLAKT